MIRGLQGLPASVRILISFALIFQEIDTRILIILFRLYARNILMVCTGSLQIPNHVPLIKTFAISLETDTS